MGYFIYMGKVWWEHSDGWNGSENEEERDSKRGEKKEKEKENAGEKEGSRGRKGDQVRREE